MHSCRFVLGLFIFIVQANIASTIYAVENDEHRFRMIFQNELNEKNINEAMDDNQPAPVREQYTVGISDLPSWFWNFPKSETGILYAIGISDPMMKDTVKANRMALDRALMQFAMMEGVRFTGVSDLYDKNLQNKYEELYRMEGRSTLKGCYSIIDSFTTRFGERIYLMKHNMQGSEQKKVDFMVQRYKSNTKLESGWYQSENADYVFNIDSIHYLYRFTEEDGQKEMLSVCNSDTTPTFNYMYEYNGSKVQSADSDTCSTLKLFGKGLWWEYLRSLTNSLQQTVSNKRLRIKSMDEMVGNDDGRSLSNSIQRGVVYNNVQFSILEIKDNNNQVVITIAIN
jgi:hypothetical protein